jgi:hypothetical protein
MLVHEVDLQRPAAGVRRRSYLGRDKAGPSGFDGVRERSAQSLKGRKSVSVPALRQPDLRLAGRPPKPAASAGICNENVERPRFAREDPEITLEKV